MRRATLELRFVTPCFAGGADTSALAEWRSQSIRGQLRWWFRALAGAVYDGDLLAVRNAEERIFGSTDVPSTVRVEALGAPGVWKAGADHGVGLRLSAKDLIRIWKLDPKDEPEPTALQRLQVFHPTNRTQVVPTNPLQYLGYGCVGLRGLDRSCIAPGQAAVLRLTWNPRRWSRAGAEATETFVLALWAWLQLGGIGSRSRNGWGSLTVTALDGELPGLDTRLWAPLSRATLTEGIRELLQRVSQYGETVEDLVWTQLSRHTQVFAAEDAHANWDEALSHAGAWLVAFRRRYGNPHERRERGKGTLADRDYAWAAPGGKKRRQDLPDRAGFGLPLPFGKRGETVTWHDPTNPGKNGDARRASPLHLHVADLAEGYLPIFTYMPSRFLPGAGQIRFKDAGGSSAPPSSRQLGIVERFLDDLATKRLVRRIGP